MSSPSLPAGIILLLHSGEAQVTEVEALSALPREYALLRRQVVELDLLKETELARKQRSWFDAQRVQRVQIEEKLKPVLEDSPGYEIVYCGKAAIQLSMDLGHVLGSWWKVRALILDRDTKTWAWCEPGDGGISRITGSEVPTTPILAKGDIVLRIAVSYSVDPSYTDEVVKDPLCKVDLAVDPPSLEALKTSDGMTAFAGKYRELLDRLHAAFPNAETLHVFAALPVGLPFLMAAGLNPTTHPKRIRVYQFDKAAEPKYHAPIDIPRPEEVPFIASEEQRLAARSERQIWDEELKQIREFSDRLSVRPSQTWLDDVFERQEGKAMFGPEWLSLPRLGDLPLCASTVDHETTEHRGGFFFNPESKKWVIADNFIIPLMEKTPDPMERRRSARMFLLHEGLHEDQNLNAPMSNQIGGFPKVLEEVDYRADVWSFMYERALFVEREGVDGAGTSPKLSSLIRTAVNTMLSFDDLTPGRFMQIRRVSRYLIWIWQFLRTEKVGVGQDEYLVLAQKPLIELSGPTIHTIDNRVWYDLELEGTRLLEVAVYEGNKLHRFPEGESAAFRLFLDCLMRRKFDGLADALRGPMGMAWRDIQ